MIAHAAIMQSACELRRRPVTLKSKDAISAIGLVKSIRLPSKIERIAFFLAVVRGPLQNSDHVTVDAAAMFPALSHGSNFSPEIEVVRLIWISWLVSK